MVTDKTLPQIANTRGQSLVVLIGLLNKPHISPHAPLSAFIRSPVNYRNSPHSQRERQNKIPD